MALIESTMKRPAMYIANRYSSPSPDSPHIVFGISAPAAMRNQFAPTAESAMVSIRNSQNSASQKCSGVSHRISVKRYVKCWLLHHPNHLHCAATQMHNAAGAKRHRRDLPALRLARMLVEPRNGACRHVHPLREDSAQV
jgi:hypothetical protein